MSKTDNTRPWWIQYEDTTDSGYIVHACTKFRGSSRRRHNHKRPQVVQFVNEHGKTATVTRRRNTTWAALQRQHANLGALAERLPCNEPALVDCDYQPGNLTASFLDHRKHWLVRCRRVADYPGGQNYRGGATRGERKQRRRKIRQRERAALRQARWSQHHDFDLLPIREDARTIDYDLS